MKGEKTIAELSSEFGIHGEQIRQWKKRLLDGLLGIFSDKRKEGGKGRRATRNGYIAGSLDHSQDRRPFSRVPRPGAPLSALRRPDRFLRQTDSGRPLWSAFT
ncbi:MAG: hypothetical protein BA865_01265 [Desulfobacterales bacterium S5133MH4]|nr:MAG: hypothetical protein BA865_01265 [Desulfobacterales bacterium S5133MH4]